MTYQERIKNWSLHSSQRGWFAFELYKWMAKDPDIFLLVGDLGYKVFDAHFEDFPERTINCFAAEQAMMGIAVGLAMEGRKPFVYSITSFLLWRPAETIRLYIAKENVKVMLVGSGRDKDYHIDGWSHDSSDVKALLDLWPNIHQYWPLITEEIPVIVESMIKDKNPSFVSLKR